MSSINQENEGGSALDDSKRSGKRKTSKKGVRAAYNTSHQQDMTADYQSRQDSHPYNRNDDSQIELMNRSNINQ